MYFRLLMVVAVVVLSACTSTPQPVPNGHQLPLPADGQAQVVFMRSSLLASSINASLYRVVDGDIEFIGILPNGTKLIHPLAPGRHVFMVVSDTLDFMEAELAAGKTYYSLVTPRMGAWKAGFSLRPVKADPGAEYSLASSDFAVWVDGTRQVRNSDESIRWNETNKAGIRARYAEYWPVWKSRTGEDSGKRSLLPEDGQPAPAAGGGSGR